MDEAALNLSLFSKFSNNSANHGGIMYVSIKSQVYFEDTIFELNYSELNGSVGFMIGNDEFKSTFKNCDFIYDRGKLKGLLIIILSLLILELPITNHCYWIQV